MISPRLASVFRTRTGNKFYGLLSDPEDRFEGDRVQARRILRVNPQTRLLNGEVAFNGRDHYLLIHHSTDRYLALLINAWLPWVRTVAVVDPVTRVEKGGYDQELDASLPVVLEPNFVLKEQGLERIRYNIRAGGDIQVGDKIGEYVIQSVQNVSGACILEAY